MSIKQGDVRTVNRRKVSLGLIQMSCTENLEENTDKCVARIREAADSGAEVIATQELFRGPYPAQEEDHTIFDQAEPIPGPTTKRLSEVAKEKGVVIVSSHFERRAPGIYHNTACTFDTNGELLGIYRKMHIPDDPHFYEKFFFTPGDLGFKAFDTQHGKVGTLVCWDQWYPEAARLTALRGAEVIFYPTANGWLEGEEDEVNRKQHISWETVQRGHAVANGCYIAAINRVGKESNITFWGQSFIVDPQGEVICRASIEKEENLICEIDLGENEHQRRYWPFLRDRRIDAYGELTKRYID